MNEPHTDTRTRIWGWLERGAPHDSGRSPKRDLADLYTPRTLHAHVLDCLAQADTVGRPEDMKEEIARDLVRAPIRYLDPFTPEELTPLLQAERPLTRELAFRLLGRLT